MVVTGVGSLPGKQIIPAVRETLDTFPDVSYLPELPNRGPEAAMVGRGTAFLSDTYTELGPSGWRLTSAPSRAGRRARSLLREDLDALEQESQGYPGAIKLACIGPITLAGTLELSGGEKAVSDAGAVRDLTQSLAAGLAELFSELVRRMPATRWLLQLDEPLLPTVVAGGLATASGLQNLNPLDRQDVIQQLRTVLEPLSPLVETTILHCCDLQYPFEIAELAGFSIVNFDSWALVSQLAQHHPRVTEQLDSLAAWADSGGTVWFGAYPTFPVERRLTPDQIMTQLLTLIEQTRTELANIGLTPACGLAGWRPQTARQVFDTLAKTAPLLDERLHS